MPTVDSAQGDRKTDASRGEITELLDAWQRGDPTSAEKLIRDVWTDLHRLAEAQLSRPPADVSLQPTELLNELYLKLEGNKSQMVFENRRLFFGFASRVMRALLVDHARRKTRSKRGGRQQRVELDSLSLSSDDRQALSLTDVLAVDEALVKLLEIDPQAGRVVELRFFGGLSVDETAVALEIGRATVARKWRSARAWLLQQLSDGR